jgi:Gluconate 2-dehydrogenase subunit 3
MQAHLRAVVAAVVATLLPEIEPAEDQQADTDAFAVAFVIAQIERMPAHLRTAMLALETIFNAGAIARYGKPFRRLTQVQRNAYVAVWATSRIGAQRDFVRFHRNLAIFALYSKRATAA